MTGRSMVAHNEGFKSGERAGRLAAAEEIERLQEAKRRALAIADERSKENVALRKALKSLANEIHGLWDAFEHGLRAEISNTNYAVVRDKLAEADQVLGAVGTAGHES